MIQKMEGHHGEVWALALSNEGKFVVSGSHDRSIRVWEKTDEPVSTNPSYPRADFRSIDGCLLILPTCSLFLVLVVPRGGA